ncbi:MAG: rhomboid family intramembrane serine protease [Robiginitomaculum sp.]|nr:rhomboid family intramembrane serine protease [Robiginitomaculum sp.]
MNNRPTRPPLRSQKEPMLNVEDPAPFWLVTVLLMCHLAYVMAPNSYQGFASQAGLLAANDGHVILEGRPLGNISTLLTHTLLHAGWGHVLMNCGFILAFGIITIRGVKSKTIPILSVVRRGSATFLAIFILGAIAGGLGQWLHWYVTGANGVALGASTGGAALFASAAWVIGGRERLISFGVILVVLDIFNIMMGGHPAWAGHLGGYLAGAGLAILWVRPNSSGMSIFG